MLFEKKSEINAEQINWNLNELFNGISDPNIEINLKKSEILANKFYKKYKNKINKLNPTELKEAYIDLEKIMFISYRLHQYVSLLYSINTSNNDIKKLKSKIEDAFSKINNLIIFFNLEIGQFNKNKYKKLEKSIDLDNYKYQFSRTWITAKYNLSEKEEQVINLKNITGAKAFKKLYSDLNSSFQFKFELDGEIKELTGSELRSLRYHENQNIRSRAMQTFFNRYKENELIFSHIYNNIVKHYVIERNLRGYENAISPMNINNDLENKTVELLHDITNKSYHLVKRYYKLKSKILKLKNFTLADIYAPMPNTQKKFTWNESKNIILDAFSSFDKEFYQKAKIMFDEQRIDASVSKGKRGGAFCSSSTNDLKPYIMLNFLGQHRDVTTIAHELGHAIHSMFSAKQTLINFDSILPLAETASVFSEMLISDLMLKNETDQKLKQNLLTNKLENIFATSHRQNMFSQFEISSHKKIENKLMSSNELCQLYEKEIKKMFGDSITHYSNEYFWEWSSIPHIFEMPFYVYAYNFANLLVISIYQQYLEEGKNFIPKFKIFLESGSSKSPIEITKELGVNINNYNFWKKSLTYISELIDQLEKVLK